ncbi:MAG: hypothetical protein WBZ42_08205 [Halobacteriota archaeon]
MTLIEGEELLDAWLSNVGRTLQDDQRQEILSKFVHHGLPLYLKLAFERAKEWRSFSPRVTIGDDVPELVRGLFSELSQESKHGFALVSHTLGYLAASKKGLTEDELLDILASDEDVFKEFLRRAHMVPPDKKLPTVVWSRLYMDLKPYLEECSADGTTLLAFYHRQLEDVALTDYLQPNTKTMRHQALARYFLTQSTYTEAEIDSGKNLRKLSELPYQEACGQMWFELEGTLCNFSFIEAKAQAGIVRDLVEDYLLAESNSYDLASHVSEWAEWRDFVTKEAHAIQAYFKMFPQIIFQQAFNSSKNGVVHQEAQKLLDEGSGPIELWFERVNRPAYPASAVKFVLDGHEGIVQCLAVSRDKQIIVSGSSDSILRAWDLKSGECSQLFKGHTKAIFSVLVTEKDEIISSSWDRTCRVWDLNTGECLRSFEGHDGPVTLLVPINGDSVASVSLDKTIRIWDVASGKCTKVLKGHSKRINHALLIGQNTLASASDDMTVCIWDLEKGACINVLKGHKDAVLHLALSGESKIFSSSADGSIRLWNARTGETLRVFEGHKGPVAGSITFEENRLLSYSFDYTIRLWSVDTGNCLQVFDDHDEPVTCLSLLGDGKFVSGSQDSTLRLWNANDSSKSALLSGHRFWINSLLPLSAGVVVSASSDRTLRVWDLNKARKIKTEDAASDSCVSRISAARKLADAFMYNAKTAVSYTPPSGFQVWDLVAGRCTENVDSDSVFGKELWEVFRKRIKNYIWSLREVNPSDSLLEIPDYLIDAVDFEQEKQTHRHLRTGEGICCRKAVKLRVRDGIETWRNLPIEAFYPVKCNPWVSVYGTNRTIAFDSLTREAHVLLLHGYDPVELKSGETFKGYESKTREMETKNAKKWWQIWRFHR